MTNQRINFAPSILPLSTVINQIKNVQRNGLDLQPSYQRGFIWNQEFKEKLIYSVIKRYPIGSISIRYLEEPNEKNAKSEVVDGQQRLTTLYHFITGTEDFKIRNEFARKIINEILSIFINEEQNDKKFQKLKTKFNHKGNIILRYEDLPSIIQDVIKSYPITISGISNATTEQISEYFRFLQNQEALRAGEILKSIPSSYLENYLREIKNKEVLLSHLNYNDKRLEFDKLFYSIIGLIDNSVPFGSQDKVIREYVFNKNTPLEGKALSTLQKLLNNLKLIVENVTIANDFIPTKRYIKLLLLLCSYSNLNFEKADFILKKLKLIDDRIAKFSSTKENILMDTFNNNKELISKYRPIAELCVRTHRTSNVTSQINLLEELVTTHD